MVCVFLPFFFFSRPPFLLFLLCRVVFVECGNVGYVFYAGRFIGMHSSLPELPVQYLFFFLSPTTIVVVVVGVVVSPKICRGFVNMCEDRRESFSGGTERPSL